LRVFGREFWLDDEGGVSGSEGLRGRGMVVIEGLRGWRDGGYGGGGRAQGESVSVLQLSEFVIYVCTYIRT
jgi:hypothetical protein